MKKRKILMFAFATILMFVNANDASAAIEIYKTDSNMTKYTNYDKIKFVGFETGRFGASMDRVISNEADAKKNGVIFNKNCVETTNSKNVKVKLAKNCETRWFEGENSSHVDLSQKFLVNLTNKNEFSFPVKSKYDGKDIVVNVTLNNFEFLTSQTEKCPYGTQPYTDENGKAVCYTNPSILVWVNKGGSLNFFSAGLKYFNVTIEGDQNLKVFSTFDDIDGNQKYNFSNGIKAFVTPTGKTGNTNCSNKQQQYYISNTTVSSCNKENLNASDDSISVSFYYEGSITVKADTGKYKNAKNKTVFYDELGFGFGPETIKKMTCEKDVNCTAYGKIPNTDNKKIEVNKLTLTEKINTCCKARPNPTCSTEVSCKVGVLNNKNKDLDISGMSEEQRQIECCAPCKYNDSSFDTDAKKKACCDYFTNYLKENDHLPDNPSVTLDKIMDEIPSCFPEPPVENFVDTICKVTPSEFKYTGTKNNRSSVTSYTKSSISMLTLCGNGQCGEIPVTDDSTNTSENSEEDNKTEEEILRERRETRYTNRYCYFDCNDELTVKMPGKYNETIQIGQNFVWPDSSKYKVEVTAKKSCWTYTDTLVNRTSQESDACVNYYRNTLSDSDASLNDLDIKLSYSEKPDSISGDYTVNEEPLERTIVEKKVEGFSVTETANYTFPKNLFQYAPVNSENFKIISLQTDASKYINVGYSNLPVSWNLKPNSKLYTTLKISGTFNNDMTSNFSDYKCELTVDYPGGNKGVCPQNTPNAGNDPDGNYSACLKEHDKNYCVGLYCSADFCKKDCVNGKCTESDETSEYRRCLEQNKNDENKYSICEPKCKNSSSVVVYRTIALSAPFPGKEGKGRTIGTNWANVSTDKYITSTSRYDSNPMYEITLGPSEISKIRSYNAQNTGYSNDTLICTNGEECRSDFIKQFNNIFKSDTCGMNNNFTECDSR